MQPVLQGIASAASRRAKTCVTVSPGLAWQGLKVAIAHLATGL